MHSRASTSRGLSKTQVLTSPEARYVSLHPLTPKADFPNFSGPRSANLLPPSTHTHRDTNSNNTSAHQHTVLPPHNTVPK
jgi:hypothetical protein